MTRRKGDRAAFAETWMSVDGSGPLGAPLELLDVNSPLTSPGLCSSGQDCGSWWCSQSEAGKMLETEGRVLSLGGI